MWTASKWIDEVYETRCMRTHESLTLGTRRDSFAPAVGFMPESTEPGNIWVKPVRYRGVMEGESPLEPSRF